MLADGQAPTMPPEAWTPEHLVPGVRARCTVKSLQHHARRADIRVEAAANASGTVTRPDGESRFRFIEARCELDIRLDPTRGDDALAELLARAEHDCFIGSSLTAAVSYEWVVNGSARSIEA